MCGCSCPPLNLQPCVCCSVEEQGKGWVRANVMPSIGNHYMPQQRELQTGSILILTSQKPPARQARTWLQRGLAAGSSMGHADSENRNAEKQQAAGEPATEHAQHDHSPSTIWVMMTKFLFISTYVRTKPAFMTTSQQGARINGIHHPSSEPSGTVPESSSHTSEEH